MAHRQNGNDRVLPPATEKVGAEGELSDFSRVAKEMGFLRMRHLLKRTEWMSMNDTLCIVVTWEGCVKMPAYCLNTFRALRVAFGLTCRTSRFPICRSLTISLLTGLYSTRTTLSEYLTCFTSLTSNGDLTKRVVLLTPQMSGLAFVTASL